MVVVRGTSGITTQEMLQLLLGEVFLDGSSQQQKIFDVYAKFDRLEQLRENLRKPYRMPGVQIDNPVVAISYCSQDLFWTSLDPQRGFLDCWSPLHSCGFGWHGGLITTTQAAWLHSWISSTSQKVFFQYDLDGRHVASTKNCRIPGILPFCVKGNSVQNSVRPSRAFHLIALYPCHLSKCPKGWTPFEASTR